MKTKLFYLLTIVIAATSTSLQGQDCIKCDTNSNNSGEFATAIGKGTQATGYASFAMGHNSQAKGIASGAFGISSEAWADDSFAFGRKTRVIGGSSIILGSGYLPSDYLINGKAYTLMIGFNSTAPTFFVGESPSDESQTDRTGRIGIGNMTEPQAKLHIYSDDNEAATLFLEPANWNTDYNAQIWLGDTSHGISAEVDRGLVFSTGNHFEFNNGFLGLATEEPSALLDVNGTARIRSLSGNGERFVVADSAGNLSTSVLSGQCVGCSETTVTGEFASAIGFETIAHGKYSFSGGWLSETGENGRASFAFGYEAKAMDDVSFAMGVGAEALGNKSFAFGSNVISEGASAKTFGTFIRGFAPGSITMGSGYSKEKPLVNYKQYSFALGFNSDVPTFFVGPSPGPMSGTTGRVGIGTMDPSVKLHIRSDEGEQAVVFIEPSNWLNTSPPALWLGDEKHSISADSEKGLIFESENNFVFRRGDVYIEDIDKGIIMKSPDGKCWRGTVDNSGSLNFILLETCPGSPNGIDESGTLGTDDGFKVYPNPTNKHLNIEIKNPDQTPFTICLLDEKGVELLTKQIHSGKTQIYTGDLKSGIYFIRVTGNGRQMVEKVIRQ